MRWPHCRRVSATLAVVTRPVIRLLVLFSHKRLRSRKDLSCSCPSPALEPLLTSFASSFRMIIMRFENSFLLSAEVAVRNYGRSRHLATYCLRLRVVPISLRRTVFAACHSGCARIMFRLQTRFGWPTMVRDTQESSRMRTLAVTYMGRPLHCGASRIDTYWH
jgi:hypothetical protein